MMHVQSNHTTPVVGEKRPNKDPPRPTSDTRKVASFIQKFYLFGTNTGSGHGAEATDKRIPIEAEQPKGKKAKGEELVDGRLKKLKESPVSSATDSSNTQQSSPEVQRPSYSVQRLRQFWNNRLQSSANTPVGGTGGISIETLVRKTKSATIGTPTGAASRCLDWKSASPKTASRFHRSGSIGRSGKRRLTHESLDRTPVERGPSVASSHGHKRTSNAALLSPVRDTQRQEEKRQCVGSGGLSVVVPSTIPSGSAVRDSFPLATSTPNGNRIHWARRTELLGIRALTQDEKSQQRAKMPIRVENYVNNFIGVDIQSVTGSGDALDAPTGDTNVDSDTNESGTSSREMANQDASITEHIGDEVPSTMNALAAAPTTETPLPQPSSSSLGRKGNTPTRKISFMNNISPYNRRLLAGNGTKVAALTSKFNQMIQQDAGLLEQVKKRGGYIHKCGNVAYKVLEDTGGSVGADPYGFTAGSRNGSGRASLRKKKLNASATGGSGSGSVGCRTDESSDEISSASSKSSSIRKTGVKKRPSLRKNIYRRPEWAETGRSSPGVRKVLEMFEPNVHHSASKGRKSDGAGASSHGDTGKPPPGRSKPKVPDKSEQLLEKTKGIKSKKVRPVSTDGAESTNEKDEGHAVESNTLSNDNRQEHELHSQEVLTRDSAEEPNSQSPADKHVETSVIPTESSARQDTAGADDNPAKEVNIVPSAPSKERATNAEHKEKVSPPKETKEKKKGKSTVSKIYERLTFRSSKKIHIDTTASAEKPDEVVLRDEFDEKAARPSRRSFISSIEIPTIQIDEPELEQPLLEEPDVSEQKILEAICAASHRIDNLSKSFNDLTLNDPDETTEALGESEQSGDSLLVRPNASFLFRGSGGTGSGALTRGGKSQMNIAEAVNTVVINKAVSMDDHHFPRARDAVERMSLNERRDRIQRDLEDDYEPVTKPEELQAGNAQLTAFSERQSVPCTSPTISIDLAELTGKIDSFVHKSKRESENIYQSISRKNSTSRREDSLNNHLIPEDTISINSYESFENYESIEHELTRQTSAKQHGQNADAGREEDTYEICSPPPDLPPARDDARNDLTLPQPKRNLSSSPKTLPKHLQVTYQSNYEKIKYSKIPPRPPKPEEVPLPPRNNPNASFSTSTITSSVPVTPTAIGDRLNITLESISSAELPPLTPGGDLLDKSPHGPPEHSLVQQENIYEENIYDFIPSADGVDYDDPACGGSTELEIPAQDRRLYEQQQLPQHQLPERLRKQPPSPPADSVSLVSSNCYESIGSRLDFVRNMALNRRNMGGSTTTLASDHITNSLYGTTAGLASLTPPSERGSDTSNSADWTDISDEDEGERGSSVATTGTTTTTTGSKRPNFIVVRERKRTHQTPLRSRKLARISHPKIDDDSDHHYESLYSIGSVRNECYRKGSERSRASSREQQQQPSMSPFSDGSSFHEHRSEQPVNHDDEFDSFESDVTDEEEEDEERNRNRTDSGVDIRNAKLPDPPPSSNQVYGLVQKIKNLGTLSKSEIAKGFHKLSKKKSPKPSVGGGGGSGTATYENSPTVLPPKPTSTKSSTKSSSSLSGTRGFKLPIPLGGGAGGVPKPPPEDYENAQLGRGGALPPSQPSSPLPPVSPSLLQQSSFALQQAGGSPFPFAVSSPEQPFAVVSPPRSTSESSNVSGYRPAIGAALAVDATRKKSKSSKSLRSKLRKSLVSDATNLNIGSSFNGSRSTFYVTTSTADVDSGIFNGTEATVVSNDGSKQADVRRKSIALGGTTASSRPSIPPPPPPAEAGLGRKGTAASTRKLGATSWYAECAVFKQPHSFATDSDQSSLAKGGGGGSSPRSPLPQQGNGSVEGGTGATIMMTTTPTTTTTTSASSWYADIYQTSGASVASSSESSGVSTGGEGGPGDDHSHSMFVNEPLYQIYNAAKLESITRDIDAEISGHTMEELYDDGYEKISERNRRRAEQEEQEGRDKSGGSTSGGSDGDDRSESSLPCHLRKPSRPTALELIEPHVGKLRTLWCEVPEVRNSEILATLTPTEKRLQEAKFEILTSEASYLKSLNLLRTHFINHPAFRDQRILSAADRKTLFSSIIPVQECSDRLLCDLENCWQDNIMLLGQSHSIFKHAEKHFHVYVSYCEHQAKIDRTLKTLKATRPDFARTLAELEADPVCCSLSLSSFLMLPMQRITRMRLLLDAVLQRCHPENDDEFASWEKTFVLINRILTQCNDAAHRSEQMHEMERLSRQIEFPTHVRPLAIVPCGIGAAPSSMHRKLEKRGELVHLLWRGDDAKLTFGKKFSKSNLYAFLFTDLLVLTKKKGDESFLVMDYCQRALLSVSSGDVVPGLPAKEMQTIGKNLIIMTLLENHEGKTVEMILSCPSETERERWLTVTEPPASENPDEKIYEQWNCPQVIAVHPYQALQPDELDLDIKDVVNVHRKMADGWYEGERIRDGAVGWFPSNYTKEIPSAHIRAKHIKQRHMLLTYTSKYIDTAGKGHYHHHNHYGKK
uniref:DH domain-containing protein n=1 Tax=Anopheles atroparvus TaxID=41427 RepID=A0AAG5D7R7_ANOAO